MLEFIEQQMINAKNNITKVYSFIDKTLETVIQMHKLPEDAIVYNGERDAYVIRLNEDKTFYGVLTHSDVSVRFAVIDVDIKAQKETEIGYMFIDTIGTIDQDLKLSLMNTTTVGKATAITNMFCRVAQAIKEMNDPKPVEEEGPEVEIVEDPSKPKDETIA